MAFYGYNGDAGECHLTPYFSAPYDYDAYPLQSSISYSSNGYSNLEQIEQSTNYNYDTTQIRPELSYYVHNSNYSTQIHPELSYYVHNSNYSTQIHPELSYSAHNSIEPKLIQYEKGANSLETRTIISCSTKEQDDTVFEEYDPTPYGGGYDMAQTYGKPLKPSNEICYPRSIPEPNRLPLDGFDYGSIRSPYVGHGDKVGKPPHRSKEMDVKDDQKSLSGVKEKPILEKPIEHPQQDQDFVVGNGTTGEKGVLEDDILEKPIASPQQDQDFAVGNGTIGEYGYDYGRQLQQIPYGSGLEAMDICESLFGYWPCIAKENQRRNCNCNHVNSAEDNRNELWECTAGYLFGNPYGYGGDGRDQRYGDSAYVNQNYYYQQQL